MSLPTKGITIHGTHSELTSNSPHLFFDKFEDECRGAGINFAMREHRKWAKNQLNRFLGTAARQAKKRFPADVTRSYAKLKHALLKTLSTGTTSSQVLDSLTSLQQQEHESVFAYYLRFNALRDTFDETQRNTDQKEELKETTWVTHFRRGLLNPLKTALASHTFITVETIRDAAHNVAANLNLFPAAQKRKHDEHSTSPPKSSTATTDKSVIDTLSAAVTLLTNKVDAMQTHVLSTVNHTNVGDRARSQRRTITCWSCGIEGHRERECRKRRRTNTPNPHLHERPHNKHFNRSVTFEPCTNPHCRARDRSTHTTQQCYFTNPSHVQSRSSSRTSTPPPQGNAQ